MKKTEKEVAALEAKKTLNFQPEMLLGLCELPVNLRLKSIHPHKYWIFRGNIGEAVVVNTH